VGVLFSLETVSFVEQKIFSFMKSHLSVLSLSCYAAGVPLRKFLPIPTNSRVFPTLSCTNFNLLGFWHKSHWAYKSSPMAKWEELWPLTFYSLPQNSYGRKNAISHDLHQQLPDSSPLSVSVVTGTLEESKMVFGRPPFLKSLDQVSGSLCKWIQSFKDFRGVMGLWD
jgi:hypothetical protein